MSQFVYLFVWFASGTYQVFVRSFCTGVRISPAVFVVVVVVDIVVVLLLPP